MYIHTLDMGSLTEKPIFFFDFIFKPGNHIKFFYEIVRFSVITTE